MPPRRAPRPSSRSRARPRCATGSTTTVTARSTRAVPCTSAAQCDDADRCTTDTCATGVCAHAPVTGCPCVVGPEVCGDGIDNDCDGLTDCADPDCAADPACAPPPEMCGNCVDDNHDGLVDWEDPQRSEEHTSELQSPCNLVCRLLLEKKKKKTKHYL